ncbi:MAG: SgcJ/EcaC family oxidoreductase [Pseudomonadota bacterium]
MESGISTHKTAKALLLRWFAALETGNSENVVALYAINAVLLPTMASGVLRGHDCLTDYFSWFLKRKPKGRLFEQYAFDNGATLLHAGLYEFQLADPETGDVTTVQARFSFVYTKTEDGDWRILHHHSSVFPMA